MTDSIAMLNVAKLRRGIERKYHIKEIRVARRHALSIKY